MFHQSPQNALFTGAFLVPGAPKILPNFLTGSYKIPKNGAQMLNVIYRVIVLFFSFYDTPLQHCCCTWNVLLPAAMFRAQGLKPTPHPCADPRKVFFPSFFCCSTSQLGQGHGVVPTFPVLPSGTPAPLQSAQHVDSLSFKGSFNPGISQAFEPLLPRFQPRPPENPV